MLSATWCRIHTILKKRRELQQVIWLRTPGYVNGAVIKALVMRTRGVDYFYEMMIRWAAYKRAELVDILKETENELEFELDRAYQLK